VLVAGVGTKGDHVVFLGPTFDERKAAACLSTAMMGRNGVTVKQRKAFGTTVYFAAGPGAGGDALAWSKASGPIAADHEAWLLAALDPKAPKAGPDLVALATSVDHGRMFWLAALVSDADIAGLGVPPGSLTGPFALRAGVDIDGDATFDVDLTFATEAAAVQAAEFLRSQFATMQDAAPAAARPAYRGPDDPALRRRRRAALPGAVAGELIAGWTHRRPCYAASLRSVLCCRRPSLIRNLRA
jgi:hypothetical protein